MSTVRQYSVVVVDMANNLSEYVFATYNDINTAFACVCELEQYYDLFFDMYSDLEFVVREAN